MAYFPFMIQLDDKQCLIVGGGAVAARKAAQMCEFGACVTVVAPEICAELLAIADTERIDETAGIVENIDGNCQKKPERIRVWKREVTEADISGMDVVIMATDDAELNSQYAELCRSKHILVNVVDVKKDSRNCSGNISQRYSQHRNISLSHDSRLIPAESHCAPAPRRSDRSNGYIPV